MAVVTSDYLTGVLSNFRALFEQDFQAAMNMQAWRDLVIPMRSSGAENQYTWFGSVPKMRNVTHTQGVREGLPRFAFTIVNDEFQAILEVERAVMERDQLNLVRPRINQMGLEAARHPGELIFNLFESNPNAFDGAALIANTRVVGGSANIDNLLAGSGITVATFQVDLGVARGVMRNFQDDQGRPMNLLGNTIVIPTSLEQVVWQALNVSQGQLTNPVLPATTNGSYKQAGYNVIVNPFLVDQTDWYLLASDGMTTHPFIFQLEVDPRLESGTNPNEQAVIESRKFLYSAYYRGNVGVTDPRFIVKTVNA